MEKKVLLIDDEASLRRKRLLGLMQKGYQTEPCESGMKALQTLETYRQKKVALDCAIVDIRLPDIDGLKLLKVIKLNYPQLPVIIITGYGSETMAEEAKTADAYLENLSAWTTWQRCSTTSRARRKRRHQRLRRRNRRGRAGNERLCPRPPQCRRQPAGRLPAPCTITRMSFTATRREAIATWCSSCRRRRSNRSKRWRKRRSGPMKGVAEVVLLPVEAPMLADNVIDIMGLRR